VIDSALKAASEWEALLAADSAGLRAALRQVYPNAALAAERRGAVIAVLQAFIGRFGDLPVALFRAPGRINLRGMHVDSHGGFLNLATHQRETLVVAALQDGGRVQAVNTGPDFHEVNLPLHYSDASRPWEDAVAHGNAQRSHGWGDYLAGCAARLTWESGTRPRGFVMAVDGSVPTGAALSSSSSLCCAVYGAMALLCEQNIDPAPWIRAVRGAEWYAGARIGTSDQGAIILGRANHLTFAALPPESLDAVVPRFVPFPKHLAVLVVNTYTNRSLSGEHLLAYTQNRFAYAMALDILRSEMHQSGFAESFTADTTTFADLTPERFESYGGELALFELIKRIPEQVSIAELCSRYQVKNVEAIYETYFGNVAEDEKPKTVALRGPLLFGISESLRAAEFAQAISVGDGERAGDQMNIGHNGDRVVDVHGNRRHHDVSDTAIDAAIANGISLRSLSGAYGASSTVLDSVVDAALVNGAFGASLTGAGIAGCVLVLCTESDVPDLTAALENHLRSGDFARRRGAALTEAQCQSAVVRNIITEGAGPLPAPQPGI
jgi:galactokinase